MARSSARYQHPSKVMFIREESLRSHGTRVGPVTEVRHLVCATVRPPGIWVLVRDQLRQCSKILSKQTKNKRTVGAYLKRSIYFYFMHMNICLHACVCTTCEGQKRASGPLEQEFGLVVSHHMGSKNTARSSTRASSALNC